MEEPAMPINWEKLVTRQRETLKGHRAAHAKEIERIDRELADLDATERVLAKFGPELAQDDLLAATEPSAPYIAPTKPRFEGTKKDMVLAILHHSHPSGLRAEQIKHNAKALFHSDINPNTLTVSLGRLKNNKKVRIDGRTWFFVPPENPTNEKEKDNAPSAEAGEASSPMGRA